MRSPSARALDLWLARVLAIALLTGCAVGSSPERTPFGKPVITGEDLPAPPDEIVPHRPGPGARDESTADIFPDSPLPDAGSSAISDDGAAPSELDGATPPPSFAGDAEVDSADAGSSKRCQLGSRSLTDILVSGSAGYTVLMDESNIYYQNALSESGTRLNQDIMVLPRTVLYDSLLPVTPRVLLHDDDTYAIDALVSDGGNYLYFIGMPRGDRTNQGLFSVQKRERAAIESLPIHALASDDSWPGQLAMDESYFYLASIGASSRSLRIVRIARVGYQREELWLSTGAGNDDVTVGAMTLLQGDIALDRDHVYFSARINRERGPHQFRIYRLDKQGHHQTPALLTTLDNTYGGLASDGTHLFFSDGENLVQWELASGTREPLTRQEGMIDLSYTDGVISWTPSSTRGGQLNFFCL